MPIIKSLINIIIFLLFVSMFLLVFIDQLEHPNPFTMFFLIIKLLPLIIFYQYRMNSPTFYWELLLLLFALPFIEYEIKMLMGQVVSGPPIFLHWLPAILILVLLVISRFL